MRKKIKTFLLNTLLSLLGLAAPASLHAQFLGYTSPQTVNTTLMNGVTAPTTAVIPNLGQSIHQITYTITSPCTTGFFMSLRIEGSNNGTTWFPLSEDATDQNSGMIQASTVGGLSAIGVYGAMRVNLATFTCLVGTPSITVFYAGTSTAPPTNTGPFYQASPYRKIIVQNQNINSFASLTPVTVNLPAGNTGGSLYINCSVTSTGANAACPTGAQQISVSVIGYVVFGTSSGTAGNVIPLNQTLPVPGLTNPVLQIPSVNATSLTFGFSGGSGDTTQQVTIVYVENSTPSSSSVADPCTSSGAIKITLPINITTATTTALISGITSETISVCGGSLTIATSATSADTIAFEYGSAANCGTGTTLLTGTFGAGDVVANTAIPVVFPGTQTNLRVPASTAGNGFCAVTAGTTVNVQGYLTFVQQ